MCLFRSFIQLIFEKKETKKKKKKKKNKRPPPVVSVCCFWLVKDCSKSIDMFLVCLLFATTVLGQVQNIPVADLRASVAGPDQLVAGFPTPYILTINVVNSGVGR